MQFVKENKLVMAVVAVILALAAWMFLSGKVHAADKGGPIPGVSRAEAEQMFPTAPWTAFYVTAFVATGSANLDVVPLGVDGWGVGGRIGGDVQLDRLVVGAFCDGQYNYVTIAGSSQNGNEYGCGARAGFLFTSGKTVLAYGLVQPKWMSMNSYDTHGIAVGGGLEVAITQHWRVGMEYTSINWADSPIGIGTAREQAVKATLTFALPVGR